MLRSESAGPRAPRITRDRSSTCRASPGHCFSPGGRPPVTPDVRAGGHDRQERERITPARTDDKPAAVRALGADLSPHGLMAGTTGLNWRPLSPWQRSRACPAGRLPGTGSGHSGPVVIPGKRPGPGGRAGYEFERYAAGVRAFRPFRAGWWSCPGPPSATSTAASTTAWPPASTATRTPHSPTATENFPRPLDNLSASDISAAARRAQLPAAARGTRGLCASCGSSH